VRGCSVLLLNTLAPGFNVFPSVGEFAIIFAFLAFGVLLYKMG